MSNQPKDEPQLKVDEAVGATLKRLRLERDLSLANAAQQLEVSEAELGTIENGATRASPDLIIQACRLFNAKVSDFFVGAPRRQRRSYLNLFR